MLLKGIASFLTIVIVVFVAGIFIFSESGKFICTTNVSIFLFYVFTDENVRVEENAFK